MSPDDDEAVSLGSLFAPKRTEYAADHVFGFWHLLPDLLLERIYRHLTIRERYYASQVGSRDTQHFRAHAVTPDVVRFAVDI